MIKIEKCNLNKILFAILQSLVGQIVPIIQHQLLLLNLSFADTKL